MFDNQQIEDPQINVDWENHIRAFFTARLPGNESKYNFTEILANFPFMLEWVIQNRPAKPVEVYFETPHMWWTYNSGYPLLA